MERLEKKKPWMLLVLSLFTLIGLGYMIFSIPPAQMISFFGLSFSYLWIFFPLLFLFLYGVAGFSFKSGIQGILIASVICGYLLFRLSGLTNPLFAILLFVLFLCLEVIFWKKR